MGYMYVLWACHMSYLCIGVAINRTAASRKNTFHISGILEVLEVLRTISVSHQKLISRIDYSAINHLNL